MNEQNGTSHTRRIPPAPSSPGIGGAFHFRLIRLPWGKAIRASLTMGACILIGIAMGRLAYGLIICIGAFTSLYIGNEPYRKRASKMGVIAVGLALSVALSTLLAGTAWGMALALGLVSAVATFICGAWSVRPPAAYFFILASAIGTALPVHPSEFALRGGLVLIGGGAAWIINMAAWPWHTYGPETQAVAGAYRALANFAVSIGMHEQDAARVQSQHALDDAEDAVSTAAFWWRQGRGAQRLLRLTQTAQSIYMHLIEREAEGVPVSQNVDAFLRALADTITDPDRAASLKVPERTAITEPSERLEQVLEAALFTFIHLDDTSNERLLMFHRGIRTTLSQALQRHSLVMPAVARISIAVMAATLIAAALGNPRPYWVPLTTACVLQGITVLAAVHRTVQRAIGTLLGLLLGALILSVHPGPYWVMVIIMALQLVVELVIVRNYGVAVVFITPIPLLLVELALRQPVRFIVTARGMDTLLGCLIGAAAGILLWHRASSVRLQGTLAEAISAQGDLLAAVLAAPAEANWSATSIWRRVETATGNLRIVYDRAVNEFSRLGKASQSRWPQVIAVERLGYLLLAMSQNRSIPNASERQVGECRGLFRCLGNADDFDPQAAMAALAQIELHPALHDQLSLLIDTVALAPQTRTGD